METSSIRMKDGRGMLWPDSFTEERLDMLPDSVPALLVLWNRYHNVRSQSSSRDRMSEVCQMAKQATLPLWNPISCIV